LKCPRKWQKCTRLKLADYGKDDMTEHFVKRQRFLMDKKNDENITIKWILKPQFNDCYYYGSTAFTISFIIETGKKQIEHYFVWNTLLEITKKQSFTDNECGIEWNDLKNYENYINNKKKRKMNEKQSTNNDKKKRKIIDKHSDTNVEKQKVEYDIAFDDHIFEDLQTDLVSDESNLWDQSLYDYINIYCSNDELI
jgi:hypothetical protein